MEACYAADRREHVESFAIPVERSQERRQYVVALGQQSLLPRDEELAALRSYRDYVISCVYSPDYGDRLRAMPLAYVDGHNTTTFQLGLNGDAEKGWFYSKLTWETPRFPNPVLDSFRPYRLLALLDKIEDSACWAAWKDAHPEFLALEAADSFWTPAALGPRHRPSPLAAAV